MDLNVNLFEDCMRRSARHSSKAEWELAENALRDAESICRNEHSPIAAERQLRVSIELAEVSRRHGRYKTAIQALEAALSHEAMDEKTKVKVMGELGVNQRHVNDIERANATFQAQYDLANKLDLRRQVCRAAGNLGMTCSQLYSLQTDKSDKSLLLRAIDLLQEREQSARDLQSGETDVRQLNQLQLWEIIGATRLGLAYILNGERAKAIDCAQRAVNLNEDSTDPTSRAMTHMFYGIALLSDGQAEAARIEFNYPDSPGRCTPAIALCKEPSEEYRGYLRDMIELGVNLDAYDEQGYTALDYVVYNEDKDAMDIVSSGLVNKVGADGERERQRLANLRKHFREIFHSEFRPILKQGQDGCVRNMRRMYADILSKEGEKASKFDVLRLVKYTDFRRHGSLPRFNTESGITHILTQIQEENNAGKHNEPFIVFLSYRWAGTVTHAPDDEHHTQYRRIIGALEELLDLGHDVARDDVYVWLDWACIDQDNNERKERGVNSLPLHIAQCDAMLSLVDENYFSRAWCAAEVRIMQALVENSSNIYRWYEHRLSSAHVDRVTGALREGQHGTLRPSLLAVHNEGDRQYIAFLERQSLLLGNA